MPGILLSIEVGSKGKEGRISTRKDSKALELDMNYWKPVFNQHVGNHSHTGGMWQTIEKGLEVDQSLNLTL